MSSHDLSLIEDIASNLRFNQQNGGKTSSTLYEIFVDGEKRTMRMSDADRLPVQIENFCLNGAGKIEVKLFKSSRADTPNEVVNFLVNKQSLGNAPFQPQGGFGGQSVEQIISDKVRIAQLEAQNLAFQKMIDSLEQRNAKLEEESDSFAEELSELEETFRAAQTELERGKEAQSIQGLVKTFAQLAGTAIGSRITQNISNAAGLAGAPALPQSRFDNLIEVFDPDQQEAIYAYLQQLFENPKLFETMGQTNDEQTQSQPSKPLSEKEILMRQLAEKLTLEDLQILANLAENPMMLNLLRAQANG